eukprot:CAMPEP_0181382978 /NCGR_PEP_ID=MMETSP1106-20121128/21078_1 /TAXON_ID=81844 /ORGANISM="Mantoniella antarctica, Strain SL-175" /LENGTH=423 /DNA_ID=CAMNT_0023502535 /DNA_START=89 /DNA_END=1361 /DNA_ORIENTATION=-
MGLLEGRGALRVVAAFAVLVTRGGGGNAGWGDHALAQAGRAHGGHGHGDVRDTLLELELRARMRGERPSPTLGLEGLHIARVKQLKATACYRGSECDSALCVENQCVCPLLYSGPGCAVVMEMPTKERSWSNHSASTSSNHSASTSPWSGAWCVVAFDHPKLFPAKPVVASGSVPLRTFLNQALKGRARDLPAMADFSTCAVVGSSGSLLDRRLGVEIESHTAVFRANDAPTAGFEAHVGRKTTLRVQNIAYCGFRERTTELTVHYTDHRRAHVGAVCTAPHIKRISPRMLAYSKAYWTRARPPAPEDLTLGKAKLSGGFYAVALAMHLCGRVDVYGFDQHDEHYYDKVKQVSSPFAARHAWTYERRCLKLLGHSGEKGVLQGRITVTDRRNWPGWARRWARTLGEGAAWGLTCNGMGARDVM